MPTRAVQFRHLPAAICLTLLLVGLTGCAIGNRARWQPPTMAVPVELSDTQPATWAAAAEQSYALAFQHETAGNPACVEHYFQAAAWAWTVIEPSLVTATPPPRRGWSLYHSALTKLLVTAQRFGRWCPGQGLMIAGPTGPVPLQANYHGFSWIPADFNNLHPVGEYRSPYLEKSLRESGLGVPLVAVHHKYPARPFTQEEQPFPATVVLRPCDPANYRVHSECLPGKFTTTNAPLRDHSFQLEFYDPLRQRTFALADSQVTIAYDLSASFAYASQKEDRAWLRDFLHPGTTAKGRGLFMIEPYQRGKVPIVFVHGLLSDPRTWANLANELRGHREIVNRCQLMAFQYGTGEPFLESAAELRQQLYKFRATYDPQHTDPACSQMILVGHSMGGLISKLQTTYSGDRLWQAAASVPLPQIKTSDLMRAKLTEAFFFDPNPDIHRVVFIGTPHQGSGWARRMVGRLGSKLVRPSAAIQQRHSQLVRDNPGVWSEEIVRRLPTSIDMLEPNSPLLNATVALPFRPSVALHTIAGDTHTKLRDGPTDGIVPVFSARLLGVTSEKIVDASHTHLNRHPDTVEELVRILHEHLGLPGHWPCKQARAHGSSSLATSPVPTIAR